MASYQQQAFDQWFTKQKNSVVIPDERSLQARALKLRENLATLKPIGVTEDGNLIDNESDPEPQ